MSEEFRRLVNSKLREAERTVVTGNIPRERSSINTQHHHHPHHQNPYQTSLSSALVPTISSSKGLVHQLQRAISPQRAAAAAAAGGATSASRAGSTEVCWGGNNNNNNNNSESSTPRGGAGRVDQLQSEVDELRRELRQEREAREQMAQHLVRRIKDEVRTDTIMAVRETEQSVTELNAQVRSRLNDVEVIAQACTRRCDEVTRAVKVCNSDIFELSERNTNSYSELKGQVESAFSLASTTKLDCARTVEKERIALQHRLDVELVRFAEMERQQKASVESVKERLSFEMKDIGGDVERMVSEAWENRARSFISTVNEALDTVKSQSRHVVSTATETTSKVETLTRQVKSLQSLDTAVFEQRLGQIENTMPNLSTRVDRTEKRSEALLDSNSRLTASVDVLREAADRAAAHAVRSVERLQTFEGTLGDRDARLTAVESALIHVQGAERVKSELESIKRAMTRVESVADAMKSNSARDEKVVENLERSVEALLNRFETLDSRVNKTTTKCDSIDHRVANSLERALSLEGTTDRLQTSLQQNASELATSVGVLTRRCDGIEAKVASQIEQHDSTVSDVRNRAMGVEATCNALRISVESANQNASSTRGECDKLLRKVAQLDATVAAAGVGSSASGGGSSLGISAQENYEQIAQVAAQLGQLQKKVDGVVKNQTSLHQQVQSVSNNHNNNNNNTNNNRSDYNNEENEEVQQQLRDAIQRIAQQQQTLSHRTDQSQNQLQTVDQRLAIIEMEQQQQQQQRSSPRGGGTTTSSSSPTSSSASGSDSTSAGNLLAQRVTEIESTCRVLKSQNDVTSENMENFSSQLQEIDNRVSVVEDSIHRVSGFQQSQPQSQQQKKKVLMPPVPTPKMGNSTQHQAGQQQQQQSVASPMRGPGIEDSPRAASIRSTSMGGEGEVGRASSMNNTSNNSASPLHSSSEATTSSTTQQPQQQEVSPSTKIKNAVDSVWHKDEQQSATSSMRGNALSPAPVSSTKNQQQKQQQKQKQKQQQQEEDELEDDEIEEMAGEIAMVPSTHFSARAVGGNSVNDNNNGGAIQIQTTTYRRRGGGGGGGGNEKMISTPVVGEDDEEIENSDEMSESDRILNRNNNNNTSSPNVSAALRAGAKASSTNNKKFGSSPLAEGGRASDDNWDD